MDLFTHLSIMGHHHLRALLANLSLLRVNVSLGGEARVHPHWLLPLHTVRILIEFVALKPIS